MRLFKEEQREYSVISAVLGEGGLRAYRQQKEVTLRELAQMVGVSHGFLFKVETGERCISKKIAQKIEAALTKRASQPRSKAS